MDLQIYMSVDLVDLRICRSIHLQIYASGFPTDLQTYGSVDLLIRRSTDRQRQKHWCVDLHVCGSVDLLICRSSDLSVIYKSVEPVDLRICRSTDLQIYTSVGLSICRPTGLQIYGSVIRRRAIGHRCTMPFSGQSSYDNCLVYNHRWLYEAIVLVRLRSSRMALYCKYTQ